MKNIIKKIVAFAIFCLRITSDLLIIGGLVAIIVTSYKINTIIGGYTLGIILLLLGIYFAIKPKGAE